MNTDPRTVTVWRPLAVCCAALLVLALVLLLPATAGALDLRAGDAAVPRAEDARLLADPGHTLDLAGAAAAFRAGSGEAMAGPVLAADPATRRHWIAVPLHNASDRPGTWHVVTAIPYRPDLAFALAPADGGEQVLLDTTIETAFAERPVRARLLISSAFTLDAGQAALLVIRHTAGGPGDLPLRIEPASAIPQIVAADAGASGLFYGAALTALAVFGIFSVAMRSRLGLFYCGLLGLGLLLVAQVDGIAFEVLWPAWPVWNAWATLPLLAAVCACGLVVLGRIHDGWRRLRRVCDAAAVATLAGLALAAVLPSPAIAAAASLLLVAVLLGHAILLAVLAQDQRMAGWLAVAGTLLATLLVGAAVAAWLVGFDLPDMLAAAPHRLVFLVFAGSTMAVVPGSTIALRRAHDAALQREIDAARRDAEKNRKLFEMEMRYARARDLAASRRRELQHASHDLKQPLASLRLSLDALLADRDRATRARLGDAFDYLDGLVSGLTGQRDDAAEATLPPQTVDADTAAGDPGGPSDQSVASAEPAEPYPIALITGTIEQMFGEEAAAKGLAFACTAADAVVDRPVLPLLRLVANLTSNAIKHTPAGEVRVTAGPADAIADAGAAFIEVADTGPGLSAADLARLRRPGMKGDASQGSGWGLAIVDELAGTLDARVAFHTAPGAGLRVRIVI
ncbi:MAG: hypothetical protein H6843_16040 [Rhodospirillaceae bacterium]|nr:hypothetical protein [Rhodospirillaceae bacterium]